MTRKKSKREALDRISKKAALNLANEFGFKATFDLQGALARAFERYQWNASGASERGDKDCSFRSARKELGRVAKSANKLVNEIEGCGWDSSFVLSDLTKLEGHDISTLLNILRKLSDVPAKSLSSKQLHAKFPQGKHNALKGGIYGAVYRAKNPGRKKQFPYEFLVDIAMIYQTGTGKTPRCSKSNNAPKQDAIESSDRYTGPFLKFTMAIFRLYSIDADRKAIGRALEVDVLPRIRNWPATIYRPTFAQFDSSG
tara:strand:- start:485 stop:1252 length:768 start_codon:yes stop_codon:yes gene_type:complete